MSGLFKRKGRSAVEEEQKKKTLQESTDGSDSPRPFLLTSGCYGARNPLDWSSMPSTLQNQFPHWKETSVPSPVLTTKSPDKKSSKEKKTSDETPDNSIPYFVMEKDTLVSIALKFDTSTSEIARLNKRPLMATVPIYPGELLYIPDSDSNSSFAVISSPPTSPDANNESEGERDPHQEEEDREGDDVFETKGRSSSLVEIEDEVTDTHVYVSSKFMTNQLCVHGYLVINTQSIMFKPDELDPLVEDNGSDPYEVWLPLQEIVYSYITKDYSPPTSYPSSLQSPTSLVTTGTSNDTNHTSTHPLSPNTEPCIDDQNETQNGNQHEMQHMVRQNESQALNLGNETVTTEGALTTNSGSQSVGGVDRVEPECVEVDSPRASTKNGTASQNEHQDIESSNAEIKSDSDPTNEDELGINRPIESTATTVDHNVEQTTTEHNNRNQPPDQNGNQTNGNQHEIDDENGHESAEWNGNKKAKETESCQDASTNVPSYERKDTLNSLFLESLEQSGDSLSDEGGAPGTTTPAPSPWYFLYCRLSQSSQQNNMFSVVGMKIPVNNGSQTGPVQTVRTWFIFAIPKRKVEDICKFLCSNHPRLKEESNNGTTPHEPKMINGRLEIINIKGSFSDDSLLINDAHFASSSWEIFSVRDIHPPHIESLNVEGNLPLPSLNEPSNLLTDVHLRKLMPHLVSGAVGHDWVSVYSTFTDGFSLHTLYRNMIPYEDSPVLLAVQDSHGKIFGTMVPCPLKVSDRFYGTGESFLFTFDGEEVSIFPWIGENDYIIKGSPDSIAFGSGDGYFGLWLDENLYHGSSSMCVTYNNRPLATTEQFLIHGVETWGFV